MKHLVNQIAELKSVPFMGGEVQITQFTVSDVKKIDAAGKKIGKNKASGFDEQFELIKMVLRMGVIGATEMTDEEFEGFPMGALTALSEEVLDTSGLGAGAAAAGN